MANHLGREGFVKVSSLTIGQLKNYSLTHTSDTVDSSVIGDTYRNKVATMKTWSVSGDCYWDAADAGQVALTMGATVTVSLYPMGSAASATYYTGSGIVTKFDVSGAFDGLIDSAITIEGTGTLSKTSV